MGFDFDKGKRARDERLRRDMLDALYNSRQAPSGGVSGRTLVRALPDGDAGIVDDDHAIKLMRDLVSFELASESPVTRRRGERFAPDHLFLRITAKGVQLVDEHIAPVPGVADERIAGDE